MKTDPIQDYILKSRQNLRTAAAVGEAWPDARERLVSAFLDRLDTRLKRKLKGWKSDRSDGRFFEEAYPGYYFWKPTWKQYDLGLECGNHGEQIIFGVVREQRIGKRPLSEELLNAVQNVQPSARMDSWWAAWMPMRAPVADWRNPEVLWQMHKDAKFLDSVAQQLLEVARISEPIIDRLERRKK